MTWDERFQANDTPWQRPGLNPAFEVWFRDAASVHGKQVLVPGCGTAPEPLALARLGADVTGLDIAPTAIARQKEAFAKAGLTAQWITAGIADWRPALGVDAIYEQTCLCAIKPETRTGYETFAFDSLKPGGVLYALFMQTTRPTGPPFHCELAEMRALFPAGRWRWPATDPIRSDHPIGAYELGCLLERL